ncbi:MAG: pilus assembly protein PilY, partial [Curvibacter sp.]|nr:pilus assembly protein PilY [Curvibacter sp.]
GDLLGNVWRFDLTNASPSSWKTSTYNNGSTPTPLFTTPTSTGTVTTNGVSTSVTYTQPITTAVTVPIVPSSLGPYTRVLVDFGTGQRTVQNATSAATYQSGQQSLYGIWDWDMTNWNTLNPSTILQTLSASSNTITTSKLQVQTLTSTTLSVPTNGVSGTRTVSNNTICWNGTTGCNPGQFGWYINLPSSTNEQVIYSPVLFQGAVFVVNTTVPSGNSLLNCQSNLDSGWSLALASDTGGVLQQSAFNQVSTTSSLVGLQLSAVGSPSFINAYGRNFMINNTSSGIGNVQNPSFLFPRLGQRVNWQQLR